MGSRHSATSGETAIKATAAATPGSTNHAYDLLGHLARVTRTFGDSEALDSETLVYARALKGECRRLGALWPAGR